MTSMCIKCSVCLLLIVLMPGQNALEDNIKKYCQRITDVLVIHKGIDIEATCLNIFAREPALSRQYNENNYTIINQVKIIKFIKDRIDTYSELIAVHNSMSDKSPNKGNIEKYCMRLTDEVYRYRGENVEKQCLRYFASEPEKKIIYNTGPFSFEKLGELLELVKRWIDKHPAQMFKESTLLTNPVEKDITENPFANTPKNNMSYNTTQDRQVETIKQMQSNTSPENENVISNQNMLSTRNISNNIIINDTIGKIPESTKDKDVLGTIQKNRVETKTRLPNNTAIGNVEGMLKNTVPYDQNSADNKTTNGTCGKVAEAIGDKDALNTTQKRAKILQNSTSFDDVEGMLNRPEPNNQNSSDIETINGTSSKIAENTGDKDAFSILHDKQVKTTAKLPNNISTGDVDGVQNPMVPFYQNSFDAKSTNGTFGKIKERAGDKDAFNTTQDKQVELTTKLQSHTSTGDVDGVQNPTVPYYLNSSDIKNTNGTFGKIEESAGDKDALNTTEDKQVETTTRLPNNTSTGDVVVNQKVPYYLKSSDTKSTNGTFSKTEESEVDKDALNNTQNKQVEKTTRLPNNILTGDVVVNQKVPYYLNSSDTKSTNGTLGKIEESAGDKDALNNTQDKQVETKTRLPNNTSTGDVDGVQNQTVRYHQNSSVNKTMINDTFGSIQKKTGGMNPLNSTQDDQVKMTTRMQNNTPIENIQGMLNQNTPSHQNSTKTKTIHGTLSTVQESTINKDTLNTSQDNQVGTTTRLQSNSSYENVDTISNQNVPIQQFNNTIPGTGSFDTTQETTLLTITPYQKSISSLNEDVISSQNVPDVSTTVQNTVISTTEAPFSVTPNHQNETIPTEKTYTTVNSIIEDDSYNEAAVAGLPWPIILGTLAVLVISTGVIAGLVIFYKFCKSRSYDLQQQDSGA